MEGGLSVSKLLILVVFYAQGSAEEKAGILFDSAGNTEQITREEFRDLWTEVSRVLIDNVKVIASGLPEEGYINPEVLSSYLKDLRSALRRTMNRLFEIVFTRASSDEFITK